LHFLYSKFKKVINRNLLYVTLEAKTSKQNPIAIILCLFGAFLRKQTNKLYALNSLDYKYKIVHYNKQKPQENELTNMKKKLLLFSIAIFISCTEKKKAEHLDIQPEGHEIIPQEEQNENLSMSDSIKKSFLDTLNTKESPVKIISAKLHKTQYSDHQDIELIYKNVSSKDIKAIRFEWYCENAFDKPASGKNFFIQGKSDGYTATLLKSKQTRSQVWEDFSTDANTIISARTYFVVFSDGTKWELKK
jgi:hypothetical protein